MALADAATLTPKIAVLERGDARDLRARNAEQFKRTCRRARGRQRQPHRRGHRAPQVAAAATTACNDVAPAPAAEAATSAWTTLQATLQIDIRYNSVQNKLHPVSYVDLAVTTRCGGCNVISAAIGPGLAMGGRATPWFLVEFRDLGGAESASKH